MNSSREKQKTLSLWAPAKTNSVISTFSLLKVHFATFTSNFRIQRTSTEISQVCFGKIGTATIASDQICVNGSTWQTKRISSPTLGLPIHESAKSNWWDPQNGGVLREPAGDFGGDFGFRELHSRIQGISRVLSNVLGLRTDTFTTASLFDCMGDSKN